MKAKIEKGETIWVIRHDRTARGAGAKWYFLFLRRGEELIDVTEPIAGKLNLHKELRSQRGGGGRPAVYVLGTLEGEIGRLSRKLFGNKDELLVKYAVLGQPPWDKLQISGGSGRGGDSRNIKPEARR